ncbi:MAG: sigma-54 dependent transcriptional regulator [Pseudomonadota bacterium]
MLRRNLIGESASFRQAVEQIQQVARHDVTVLLQGETGTGKELFARALHYLSPRQDSAFVPVNCGSIPDSLFENELFGHQQGAYTDARSRQIGMVSRANGGTLFLDEVDTLSLRSQAAMLRFLESQQFTPLGSQTTERGNVRIVAATNANLIECAERGQFRSDVLFRLDLLSIRIPPLHERTGDAELLAEHFLDYYSKHYGVERKALEPGTRAGIAQYTWPGNVRELQNWIQKYLLLNEPPAIDSPGAEETSSTECFSLAKTRAIADFEKRYLTELLRRTQGNVTKAARIAAKDRSALGKLLKKHRIDWRAYRACRQPVPTSRSS